MFAMLSLVLLVGCRRAARSQEKPPAGDAQSVADNAPKAEWAVALGPQARPHAVAVREDGSLLVAGDFSDHLQVGPLQLTAHGGAHDTDGFLLALEPDGTPAWLLSLSGPRIDRIDAIAALGDDVFVAATTTGIATLGGVRVDGGVEIRTMQDLESGSLVLGRIDPTGKTSWTRRFRGSGDIATAGADRDGQPAAGLTAATIGLFLTANLQGSVELDQPVASHPEEALPGEDVLAASFTLDGAPMASTLLTTAKGGTPHAAVQGPGGGGAVAGETFFGGSVVAAHEPPPPDSASMFVVAVDADLRPRWAWLLNGATADGLAVSDDGELTVVGSYGKAGEIDGRPMPAPVAADNHALVVRLDEGGVPRWWRAIAGPFDDDLRAVAQLGDAIVTGGTAGPFDLDGKSFASWPGDAVIWALSATDGSTRWLRTFGSPDEVESVFAVAPLSDHRFAVLGTGRGFRVDDLDIAPDASAFVIAFREP
ncbi:MAG: hypothetical protein KC464_18880 [Myxococcales bacterium]|nr:hypothetical protein [Myxococcales bacterium]